MHRKLQLLQTHWYSAIILKATGVVISYVLLLSIFLTGNGISGNIGFSFYWYYPFYVLIFVYGLVSYHAINKGIIVISSLILVHACVILLFKDAHRFPFILKQAVNIIFSMLVFFYYIKFENYDLTKIFRKYIMVAKLVALIGFVQVILFVSGMEEVYLFFFRIESNITFRLQSLTLEPSFVAYTFAPIVFVSVFNLTKNRRYFIGKTWSVLFIIAYLLTFSSIAYLGLILFLLFSYFHHFTEIKAVLAVFAFTAISGFAYVVYSVVPEIRVRIDDTLYGLTRDIKEERVYRALNLSSYAFLSNLHVTRQSLNESPWIGNGLGTHELTYTKTLPDEMQQYSSLNKTDANSLALRLLSETGWIGLIGFCFFLYRFRISCSFDNKNIHLWLLNNGILIMIFLCLIRNGNYSIHGKLMFLLIYYFSYKFQEIFPVTDQKTVLTILPR